MKTSTLKKSLIYLFLIILLASFSWFGNSLVDGKAFSLAPLDISSTRLKSILILISALGITYLITKLINLWLERVFPIERISSAKRMVGYIIWSFALVFLLVYFLGGGAGTGVSLGILGAGLSFAMQRPILCIVGWLVIIIRGLYKEGDRIELGMAEVKGDVANIGIMTTTLVEVGGWAGFDQSTGRILTFPNAWILEKRVLNYTSGFNWIWDEITLRIPYDSPWEKGEEVLKKIGEEATKDFVEESRWRMRESMKKFTLRTDFDSLELKPRVFVDLKDNWIELRLRYVCPAGKRRTIRSKLSKTILKEFKENKIPITVSSIRLVGQMIPGIPSKSFLGKE